MPKGVVLDGHQTPTEPSPEQAEAKPPPLEKADDQSTPFTSHFEVNPRLSASAVYDLSVYVYVCMGLYQRISK